MKISTILDQIDNGQTALPEFQRGYVWNRDQVRGFLVSLYNRYPVGSLLSWTTESEEAGHRGDQVLNQGAVNLLLDGQQRITSLYGIIRGRPPTFFDGDERAFKDLYFNVESAEFSFFMPSRMGSDPKWISVSELMIKGAEYVTDQLADAYSNDHRTLNRFNLRLNRLRDIRDIDIHVENISGEDKTLDVVVDIFNRVNSGGTKLSKGDLALAKICSTQPDARQRMRAALDDWKGRGFRFSLDWLLRAITTLTTDEARFSFIHELGGEQFLRGLEKAVRHINYLLDLIGNRLGLDHHQVLTGHFAFPVMVRYVEEQGGKLNDEATINRLLYWYIQTAIWGRYSSAVESTLGRDLRLMLEAEGDGLEALIQELALWRGSLRVRPGNFAGHTRGNRFYSLLYMLTRVGEAKDWGLGIALRKGLLGRNSALELHHVFPKHRLGEHGYDQKLTNAIANFCFLTKDSNLRISNRLPVEYFAEIEANFPGALESQWIPTDRSLWELDRYQDFLAARRELLAEATNALLDSLYTLEGDAREPANLDAAGENVPGGIVSEAAEQQLRGVQDWLDEHELPRGEWEYPLNDLQSGEVCAILDLAWPEGFQPGLDEPAALLVGEDDDLVRAATDAGYRVFEDVGLFKRYVAERILGDPYLALPDWSHGLDEAALPVANAIVDQDLPTPVVGHDVQDESGAVAGCFELAWPQRKLGVWATGGRANPLPATLVGWHLFTLQEVAEAPNLLVSELKREKAA